MIARRPASSSGGGRIAAAYTATSWSSRAVNSAGLSSETETTGVRRILASLEDEPGTERAGLRARNTCHARHLMRPPGSGQFVGVLRLLGPDLHLRLLARALSPPPPGRRMLPGRRDGARRPRLGVYPHRPEPAVLTERERVV